MRSEKQKIATQRGFTSISTRLAFWMLLVIVAVGGPLAVYDYVATRRAMMKAVSDKGRHLVELTMERLANRRQIVENSVKVLGATMVSRDPSEREDRLRDLIKAFVLVNPDIYGSAIAYEPDVSGLEAKRFAPYVFRNQSGELEYADLATDDYDYLSKDWYRLAVDSGIPKWTDPYFDEGGGSTNMTTYSVPFLLESKVAGVVTADMSLDHIENIATSIEIESAGYCFITSRSDQILFHPAAVATRNQTLHDFAVQHENLDLAKAAELLAADRDEGGFLRYAKSQVTGLESFIVYRRDMESGWGVGIVIALDELMEESVRLTWIRLCLVCIGGLSLIGIVVTVSRRVIRPLKELAIETESIAAGNLQSKVLATSASDEVGVLARSFASMRSNLQRYIDDLTESTAAKNRMESELAVAHQIQLGMVPEAGSAEVQKSGYAVAARLMPARAVGGDWYDFFELENGRVFIAVGDVSDKGVPAALLMSKAITAMRVAARERRSPAEILHFVNEEFSRDNESCMFATVLCGILNTETGEIEIASAGHTAPIVIAHNDRKFVNVARGLPIGLAENSVYESTILNLGSGDSVIAYSDGVTEAFNEERVAYGEDRLLESIPLSGDLTFNVIANEIIDSLGDFVDGAAPSDDVALLVLQFDAGMKDLIIASVDVHEPGAAHELRLQVSTIVGKQGGRSCAAQDAETIVAEVLDNIKEHAVYDTGADAPIGGVVVSVRNHGDRIQLEFRDRAKPFDPLAAQHNSNELSDGEGGFGIKIVSELAESVSYERSAHGENVLTVALRLR